MSNEYLDIAMNKVIKQEVNAVLDKIRAEIGRMTYLSIEDGSDGYDNYVDRYEVLRIIDKYRKGEK